MGDAGVTAALQLVSEIAAFAAGGEARVHTGKGVVREGLTDRVLGGRQTLLWQLEAWDRSGRRIEAAFGSLRDRWRERGAAWQPSERHTPGKRTGRTDAD
ncbi:hypothetical protein C1H46_000901 [Malus baccata]|uniref:Uncharacterized protein n=1 Tax=Malus baccata TaxID=106549 RepID=A0A540NSM9_MALBA|nr:hypothetical protein C1H46_000901 [Malus baccata]